MGNSIYNFTSPVTPRYSLPYVKPTTDMFLKHKKILLEYSTLTNGPGFVSNDNINTQIYYKLNVDSVQYLNTIFRIPCRFRAYINDGRNGEDGTILKLLKEGNTIKTVFELLSTQYNIEDPTLSATNIYQFQRLYTYPPATYTLNSNNTSVVPAITNTISISYKTITVPGQPYQQFLVLIPDYTGVIPKINWHRLLLNDNADKSNIFVMTDYCQFIQVLNNDGKTFTRNFEDLYNSASYLGASILNNTVYNVNDPTQLISTSVLIIPQDQNRQHTYGYILNTKSLTTELNLPVNDVDTGKKSDYILFVPIQIVSKLIEFEPYPTDMSFTIKTNVQLSTPKPLCYVKKPFVLS